MTRPLTQDERDKLIFVNPLDELATAAEQKWLRESMTIRISWTRRMWLRWQGWWKR